MFLIAERITLYQTTIVKQYSYFGYVSIHDGIRYGLIALNPLQHYLPVAIILGTILAGAFWGFIKNTKVAFVLSATQICLVLVNVGYAFLGLGSDMKKRLDIGNKVYYLVSRQEAEYGNNSYLLERDGPLGSCIVLGSIHGSLVKIEYDKTVGVISLQNSYQEHRDFKINAP